ncbi:transposase, partial [Wolbachia endosymbiont of Bemisia tabaci]|uniref:transposase n=1 Tax=Wolbachia endosymbiont of Bemisia tabaci TaxID=215173 RepID=UPI0034E1D582
NLRAGQTVILDNIVFINPRVRILIESRLDVRFLYLPTYSPDLNPIVALLVLRYKHNIRKISHMFTDFSDAVCFILKNVSTFVY